MLRDKLDQKKNQFKNKEEGEEVENDEKAEIDEVFQQGYTAEKSKDPLNTEYQKKQSRFKKKLRWANLFKNRQKYREKRRKAQYDFADDLDYEYEAKKGYVGNLLARLGSRVKFIIRNAAAFNFANVLRGLTAKNVHHSHYKAQNVAKNINNVIAASPKNSQASVKQDSGKFTSHITWSTRSSVGEKRSVDTFRKLSHIMQVNNASCDKMSTQDMRFNLERPTNITMLGRPTVSQNSGLPNFLLFQIANITITATIFIPLTDIKFSFSIGDQFDKKIPDNTLNNTNSQSICVVSFSNIEVN